MVCVTLQQMRDYISALRFTCTWHCTFLQNSLIWVRIKVLSVSFFYGTYFILFIVNHMLFFIVGFRRDLQPRHSSRVLQCVLCTFLLSFLIAHKSSQKGETMRKPTTLKYTLRKKRVLKCMFPGCWGCGSLVVFIFRFNMWICISITWKCG